MVTLRSKKVDKEENLPSKGESSTKKGKKSVEVVAEDIKRIVSRQIAKKDFLQSPHVRTRAAGPAPEISLSTELPELTSIPGIQDELQPKLARDEAPQTETQADADETSTSGSGDGDSDQEEEVSTSQPSRESTPMENRGAQAVSPHNDLTAADSEGEDAETDDNQEENGASILSEGHIPPEQEEAAPADRKDESADDSQDDSDDSGDELSDLAKSMLLALQSRGGSSTGHDQKTQAVQADDPAQVAPAAKQIVWNPSHNLPAPAQSQHYVRNVDTTEPDLSKRLMAPPRDKKTEKKTATKERNWHDLPQQTITDELKRDLRLLRLRGTMDTKRFYKKADKGKFPSRFAVGTVIEGPTEFYSGRLTNKERKQTITEELLADQELQASRKRRFGKLQEENQRWSRKKHKGSGERIKSRVRKTKH